MCVAENQISCVLQGAKGNFCVSPLENPHQHTHTHTLSPIVYKSFIGRFKWGAADSLPFNCFAFFKHLTIVCQCVVVFPSQGFISSSLHQTFTQSFLFPYCFWLSEWWSWDSERRKKQFSHAFGFDFQFSLCFLPSFGHDLLPRGTSAVGFRFQRQMSPFLVSPLFTTLVWKESCEPAFATTSLRCPWVGKKGSKKPNVFDCHQGPPGNLGQNWDSDAWEREKNSL